LTGVVFSGDRAVKIPLGKPREDDEEGGSGCDFDLAYAITVHKAQGSEWPAVILLIDPSYGARMICSREYVYTAISRASQVCITIGRRGVLEQMAKRPALTRRKTFLTERLSGTLKEG
jgi:exodeoxyribonuclease V alpha subunit